MKTNSFFLLIMAFGLCHTHSPAQSNETWHPVWQDLFEGETLNPNNWNIEVNGYGGGNSELQYYKAENVSVGTEPASGKGCLILTA